MATGTAATDATALVGAFNALQDGEDYELLFTVSADRADLLDRDFRQAFKATGITRVGSIETGEGKAFDLASGQPLAVRGFGHFA